MKKILIIIISLILIPYIVISCFYKEKEDIVMVKVKTKKDVIVISLEEYVMGVIAGEMPAEFDIEALKAQAVAARTYVLKKLSNGNEYILDNTLDQVYLSNDVLKIKWKNKYKKYLTKIKKAIKETKGEYLVYNDEIIDAFFFSTSTGYTENVGEVFKEYRPYLKSVESSWDDISPVFREKYFFKKENFCLKLGIECSNINVQILETTSTGRVKKIKVNNKEFSGNEFREKLGLKSNYFDIIVNQDIYIETKGYGHGVGMSQYGALGMALKGYKYDEILKYYYQDVEIKKL